MGTTLLGIFMALVGTLVDGVGGVSMRIIKEKVIGIDDISWRNSIVL